MSEKDTLRVLVSWKCNLRCSYCCNEQERFRREIQPTTLDAIDFARYRVVCISGGEPLMFPETVQKVCLRVPYGRLIVLYTNGILLDRRSAERLQWEDVGAINVGLHIPETFEWIIQKVSRATAGLGMAVRFQAEDKYRATLTAEFPEAQFRFWRMNDCERANEDRVVLTGEAA